MPITTNLPHAGTGSPVTPVDPDASIETTITWANFMRESKMPEDRDVGMADLGKLSMTGQRKSLY